MNSNVTATGMVVKAQATSTLLIDTANTLNDAKRLAAGASTKGTTSTMASSGIKPTSTAAATSQAIGSKWFEAEAAATNASTAKAGTYSEVRNDDLGSYRLSNIFYLQTFDATKSTTNGSYDASGKKLKIDSITVNYTTGDQLAPSFRVLVVVGDQYVLCAPTTTTTPNNAGISAVSGSGAATTQTLSFATISGIEGSKATLSAANQLVANMNYNEVYTATVYLYFDGEDPDCFSDHIPTTLNNYTVIVSFALVD